MKNKRRYGYNYISHLKVKKIQGTFNINDRNKNKYAYPSAFKGLKKNNKRLLLSLKMMNFCNCWLLRKAWRTKSRNFCFLHQAKLILRKRRNYVAVI